MNLPYRRRYNWKLVWRSYRHIFAWLTLIATLISLIISGERYMLEHHARLDAENENATMKAEALRLANVGAPGWVHTDWVEGTADLEVRKP
jgi:hypothetical protein